MKILLQNMRRKVSEYRKRVEERGREVNLKRENVHQVDRALNEKEASVKKLKSALSVYRGGGGGFSPRTGSQQPVNFFRNQGNNKADPLSIFSSQQPVLGGGRDLIWAGASSSQDGARGGASTLDLSRPLF